MLADITGEDLSLEARSKSIGDLRVCGSDGAISLMEQPRCGAWAVSAVLLSLPALTVSILEDSAHFCHHGQQGQVTSRFVLAFAIGRP